MGLWKLAAVVGVVAGGVGWSVTRPVSLTVLVLLLLVTLHEAGHFTAARFFKVPTPEFAVGFGPVLLSRQWKGVQWSFRAVPLGGFVRVEGMDGSRLEGDAAAGKNEVSPWRRLVIAAAGPAANVVVAVVCLVAVMAFLPRPVGDDAAVRPMPGSPAEQAGVMAGDVVVSVNGAPVAAWPEVLDAMTELDDVRAPVSVGVLRGLARVDLSVVPEVLPSGQARLGMAWDPPTGRAGTVEAVVDGGRATWELSKAVVTSMGGLVTALTAIPQQLTGGEVAPEERVVSPLGAARLAERAAEEDGWVGPVALVAAVSLFLAAFNLLPLPPLDGSHVVVACVEGVASKVRRRSVRVDTRKLAPLTAVTVMLVLILGASGLLLDVVRPL